MSRSPIDSYLQRLHERWQADASGAVADYIPPLALADPSWFGIAIATTEGHCYEIGESCCAFTIQSISKPFTYGLAPTTAASRQSTPRSGSSRPATPSIRSASTRSPAGR